MARLLITGTRISFPKLLLCVLPVISLLLFTWLNGLWKPEDIISTARTVEDAVINRLHLNTTARPVLHDSSFNPDFVLRVTIEKDFTQSCITKPSVMLVNGTVPGPEIRLIEGNVYWIRVYNDMDNQNLTMHWHGLSMAVSPFSDGTPAASQWPIPPNHYFDYELETNDGMAGTYFYHSHVGFQAVTVAGPLIVDDVGNPPYHYDDERTIALQDIFQKTDSEIEEGLLGTPFQWSGESENVIVNGQGQLPGTTASKDCNLASIDVEPDKIYRFRFIGGTALSFVTLGIEDHEQMTIIEADGAYTKAVDVSFLQIGSGQRFSVLLKTKSRTEISSMKKSQFYIQIETRDRPTLTRSYAILNYRPPTSKRTADFALPKMFLPRSPPLTLPPTELGWLDWKLESLYPDNDFPSTEEVTRRITIRTHQIIGNGTIAWAQDDSSWIETFPSEPYLVSIYKDDNKEYPVLDRAYANGGIDPVTRTFPAALGETIEIVIQNTGSDVGSVDVHPFHAHGAHYIDLGSGNGTYDPVANEVNIRGKNLAKRDTTMLYKYSEKTVPGVDMGWRAWRLRVTEPGVWMVHCHILQHMIMGMQTVWIMGNETEIMKGIPVEHLQGYLEFGGSVYGNDTHDPSPVHFKTATDSGILSRLRRFFIR